MSRWRPMGIDRVRPGVSRPIDQLGSSILSNDADLHRTSGRWGPVARVGSAAPIAGTRPEVDSRAAVVADLHCHYPMHVVMHEPRHRIEHLLRMPGRLRGDQARVAVLRAASALFNDPHLWSTERVSLEHLRRGNARLVFSVLHQPFHEWDLSRPYASPPDDRYFAKVRLQIEEVESDLDNVAELKRHGVAYIRLAHLFYRQVATNAPAIPFYPTASTAERFPSPGGRGPHRARPNGRRGHGGEPHPG